MAKIICVFFDDPIDGMPKSYARDDLRKVTHTAPGLLCFARDDGA